MSKAERLRAALRELLAEHQRDGALPTSNRFLFYELVGRESSRKKNRQGKRADPTRTPTRP